MTKRNASKTNGSIKNGSTKPKRKPETKSEENPKQWRQRKIETRRLRVGDVLAHPLNPKLHPDKQNKPLEALLTEVGQLDDLKAYFSARNGGQLTFFDGHARQLLDPDQFWDVDIYDIDDAEADLAIATFDPIGWQAKTDNENLAKLFETITSGEAALQEFLSDQAKQAGIVPPEAKTPPTEFVQFTAEAPTDYRCPMCHYEWKGNPK